MKHIFALAIALFAFLPSCKKLGICHDTEFIVKKADYTGTQLRTDGFYYGDGQIDGNGGTLYHIVIFYKNGIAYLPGSSEFKKMDSYVADLKGDRIKNVLYDWGVFSIDTNAIRIERWPPTLHGCANAELKSGTIENDTTFVLTTKELRKRNGKTIKSDISERYVFRQLVTKPDSTNNIVK